MDHWDRALHMDCRTRACPFSVYSVVLVLRKSRHDTPQFNILTRSQANSATPARALSLICELNKPFPFINKPAQVFVAKMTNALLLIRSVKTMHADSYKIKYNVKDYRVKK